jgi:hypothetical protein
VNRFRRFLPTASIFAVVALFALAGAVSRAVTRPVSDPSRLIARPATTHAVPEAITPDVDECTASAGFWAPDDDPGVSDGTRPRKMMCKRYA